MEQGPVECVALSASWQRPRSRLPVPTSAFSPAASCVQLDAVLALCPNTNEVWIFTGCKDPDHTKWTRKYILKEVGAR